MRCEIKSDPGGDLCLLSENCIVVDDQDLTSTD